MIGRRLLPCGRCGAWAANGGLCTGCGAVTTPERVPLDRALGDGLWVHVFRGTPEAVAESLSHVDTAGLPDAQARIAAAGRLVRGLGQGSLSVFLDLRDGETGAITRTKRRGSAVDMFYALPWLIVRGASAEARVVRHVHRKVRRSFGVGRVATNSTKFQMDELWVRSPAGVLRRPVRGPNALRSVDLQGAAAETPGFERPLPATVPKPGAGSGLAVVAGVAAALFLLVVCPWLVSEVARPAPGELSLGLERPELSASETRRIAQRRDTWSRRKALVAATASLKAVERLRLLRASVADTGAPLAVRLQAIRLLEDDGDRGASVLAASERTLAWGQKQIDSEVDVIEQKVRRGKVAFQEAVRLQVLRAKGEQIVALRLAVLRGLSDRSDPRAEAIAKEGLVESASSNPRLHQGWVVALSTAAPSPSTERALQIALADPSLLVAAHAGWVIAQGYPRSVPLIPLAFSRACEQARKQGGAPAALLSLARAMALSGQADRARKEFEGLAPATCEAIERVLNEVGC